MSEDPRKGEPEDEGRTSRRNVLVWMSGAALTGSALVSAVSNFVFLEPRATYGPPSRFAIGTPGDYPPGTRISLDARRICVVREGNRIAAISITCTHLGCIVGVADTGFSCPCHGSQYDQDGSVTGGPAPRALPWFKVSLAPNGDLEVDTNISVPPGTYLTV